MEFNFNSTFEQLVLKHSDEVESYLRMELEKAGLTEHEEFAISLLSNVQAIFLNQTSTVLEMYHEKLIDYLENHKK